MKLYFTAIIILMLSLSLSCQNITIQRTSDSLLILNYIVGSPNNKNYLTTDITSSSSDTVFIEVIRKVNSIPPNWLSALCIDICYIDFVDSIRVPLPPMQTIEFKMWFQYYNNVPIYYSDTAFTEIKFINTSDSTNSYTLKYYATIDNSPNYIKNQENTKEKIDIYPNPFHNYLSIKSQNNSLKNCKIYNTEGALLKNFEFTNVQEVNIENLNPGIYFMSISENGAILINKKIIKN